MRCRSFHIPRTKVPHRERATGIEPPKKNVASITGGTESMYLASMKRGRSPNWPAAHAELALGLPSHRNLVGGAPGHQHCTQKGRNVIFTASKRPLRRDLRFGHFLADELGNPRHAFRTGYFRSTHVKGTTSHLRPLSCTNTS